MTKKFLVIPSILNNSVKQVSKVLLFFFVSVNCMAQKGAFINPKEVERIESALSSDEMRGRKAGTPDIDRAANFIADEFRKAGLQPLQGNSFIQQFSILRPKLTLLKYEANGAEADTKNVIVITTEADLKVNE